MSTRRLASKAAEGGLAQRGQKGVVIDLAVEAVAGDEEPVARFEVKFVASRLNGGARADGLEDFVAGGVVDRFLRRQLAELHHAVDQRLIARHLFQLGGVIM